jgi:hypothetical protein
MLRRILQVRKPGEADSRFGMRLAVSSPVPLYLMLVVGMLVTNVSGEGSLGLTLTFWLFIGAWQWLYLVPGASLALLRKQPAMAKGLVLGGVCISIANGFAWALGLYLGVR